MTAGSRLFYRLIQYHAEPSRCEPRNIGVFAYGQGGARFRMMGDGQALSGGGLDFGPYCAAFGVSPAEAWVFAEWAEWFGCLSGCPFGEIDGELSRLHIRGMHVSVTDAMEGFPDKDATLTAFADGLFAESVDIPPKPAASRFKQALDGVLEESGLAAMPDFHRDIEIELETPGTHTFIRFDGFLDGSSPMGIKAVQFGRATDKNASAQVNDAIFTFGTAARHGLLMPGRCAILHDNPSQRRMPFLERLAGHAALLPLGSKSTHKDLMALALAL